MTRRDHGRAIGALSSKGLERLPNATDFTETDHEWIVELEGERTLVLSKAEFPKVGFIDFREPVAFGLIGGWHFTSGTDPYERFRESLESAGEGENSPAQKRRRTRP